MDVNKFKTDCLDVLKKINETKQPVIITQNGMPFVQLIPIKPQKRRVFGKLKGTVRILGDIISPVDTNA